jgi:uncharacterized caspase-like protein
MGQHPRLGQRLRLRVHSANDSGMKDNSIAFARAARDAHIALVYYSGHAMQFAGVNYLMPIDAALHDEADLRRLTGSTISWRT